MRALDPQAVRVVYSLEDGEYTTFEETVCAYLKLLGYEWVESIDRRGYRVMVFRRRREVSG